MITEKGKEVIVALLHSNYLKNNAGVEKVVLEQQNLCNDLGMTYIAIFPTIKVKKIKNHHIYINSGKYNVVIDGKEKGEFLFQELPKIILEQDIKALIIHHLTGYKRNNSLIKFIQMFKCSTFFYIHDYATICSNHALLKNNKKFCGCDGINIKKCFNCRFYFSGIKRFNFYKKLLNQCINIQLIFPSESIMNIWLDIFGVNYKNRCVVIPHQKFSKDIYYIGKKGKKIDRIKIAYIGYENRVKGWECWKKICNINNEVYLSYVLGKCNSKLKNVEIVPISFIDNGPNAMIDAIKTNDINIAFLWSTRPETYGFTFYESYIAGAYIITNNDSGNILHMTHKLKCGKSFKSETELIEFLSNSNNIKKELECFYNRNLVRPQELLVNDEIFKLINRYNSNRG